MPRLFDQYVRHAGRHGVRRRAIETQLGMFLNNMFQDCAGARATSRGGPRRGVCSDVEGYVYTFPRSQSAGKRTSRKSSRRSLGRAGGLDVEHRLAAQGRRQRLPLLRRPAVLGGGEVSSTLGHLGEEVGARNRCAAVLFPTSPTFPTFFEKIRHRDFSPPFPPPGAVRWLTYCFS